jgi:hypothetical protein
MVRIDWLYHYYKVQAILDAMPLSNMKPDEDAIEDGNEDFKYRQTFMFSGIS